MDIVGVIAGIIALVILLFLNALSVISGDKKRMKTALFMSSYFAFVMILCISIMLIGEVK